MSFQININCPDCGSPIPVESTLLIGGGSFSCPNQACGVSISLSSADIPKVAEAFDGVEQLRQQALNSSGYKE